VRLPRREAGEGESGLQRHGDEQGEQLAARAAASHAVDRSAGQWVGGLVVRKRRSAVDDQGPSPISAAATCTRRAARAEEAGPPRRGQATAAAGGRAAWQARVCGGRPTLHGIGDGRAADAAHATARVLPGRPRVSSSPPTDGPTEADRPHRSRHSMRV